MAVVTDFRYNRCKLQYPQALLSCESETWGSEGETFEDNVGSSAARLRIGPIAWGNSPKGERIQAKLAQRGRRAGAEREFA